MKTAIDWFNEQIKLNSEFRENLKGRVSFTIGLSKIDELYNQAKKMEKEHILRAYDIGSNEGYDLAKIDEIEEGHYMKEPIEYYKENFKSE